MKITLTNKTVYDYLIDLNLPPEELILALKILRHRSESTNSCIIRQSSLASYLHTYQRRISYLVAKLKAKYILFPVPIPNKAEPSIKGPCQYFFLRDLELQFQLLSKTENGAVPLDIRNSWICLTEELASKAIFLNGYNPNLSYKNIKNLLDILPVPNVPKPTPGNNSPVRQTKTKGKLI